MLKVFFVSYNDEVAILDVKPAAAVSPAEQQPYFDLVIQDMIGRQNRQVRNVPRALCSHLVQHGISHFVGQI